MFICLRVSHYSLGDAQHLAKKIHLFFLKYVLVDSHLVKTLYFNLDFQAGIMEGLFSNLYVVTDHPVYTR